MSRAWGSILKSQWEKMKPFARKCMENEIRRTLKRRRPRK